jgi:poly(A) polymerase
MEMIPDSGKEILRIIRDLAPESYLVGGAVRDHFMGRPRRADLDLAVKGNGLEIARMVVDRVGPGATLVPLDSKRFTGRVALRSNGIITIDVSALKGETIYDDLRKRDFTINSVAVVLDDLVASGIKRVIDPLGGLEHLQSRIVKASSTDAFQDDPLRILRAFRFAAGLNFRISPDTLDLIPASLPSLRDVSPERVRDELIALFAADKCFPALRSMDAAGVFGVLFPELAPMKGCGQNEYHHLDVWEHSLETVRCLEEQAALRFPCFDSLIPVIGQYLSEEPVTGRPRTALLKLAAIFHDAGKPETKFVDARGRVRFFGHEKVSEEIFSEAGARLKLATREMTVIKEWISGHMRPMSLDGHLISKRSVHRLYRKFRADIFGLFLLHLADLAASRGPARSPEAEELACNSVSRALEICSELEKSPPTPLLRGRDLMTLFGLDPGPQLGRILNHLAELQAEGEITSAEEAIATVRKYLDA